MTQKFRRGLVVGKFSPLHRGHDLVIQRALEECHEVILLSYSNPEFQGCEAEKRIAWLAALYPQAFRLVVTPELLRSLKPHHPKLPGSIPANDAPDLEHRRFCGQLCQDVLRLTVDAVFTSEDYGDGFAEELTRFFREKEPAATTVRHITVDRARTKIPVSGTLLRGDLHRHRELLPPEVYASFVKRVCILGGESTGKSTLAQELAKAFQTEYVAEYGRELWEAQEGILHFEDMLRIAETQIERESSAACRASEYLFCDTSPLTTLFYSHHMFGKACEELVRLAERRYDVTALCLPDFPFVQDGTRQPSSFRDLQHQWYLAELHRRNWPYVEVGGDVPNRIEQVRKYLARHAVCGLEHP